MNEEETWGKDNNSIIVLLPCDKCGQSTPATVNRTTNIAEVSCPCGEYLRFKYKPNNN